MIRFTFIAMLLAAPLHAEDGAKLYADQCARCHGPEGQGTKKYPQPLAGDRSPAQLAELIQKTMPEDSPGSLSLDQAKLIANDIHGRFYSDVARARSKPARIELARLTVTQYRQSVADLIGSFRFSPKPSSDQRGLKGEYYAGSFGGNKKVLERVDSQVELQFGVEPAVKEKMEPHNFSIRWTGSLIAPETGEYEFVVRTEHSTRLWLNDNNTPLIDAWVKSGKDVEFTGRIYLIGGRTYPLRLEYAKAQQGVKDQMKKPKPENSSVTLSWTLPQRVREVVPSRFLIPVASAESFVCSAKFPPDDRSVGWDRGTAISREWDDATTEAALDAAAYVNLKLETLANTKDKSQDYEKRLKAFAVTFAERAFRRPLTSEQKAIVIDKQFAAVKDPALAVKRVVLLVLKDPFFLYREVGGGNDAYDTAARLSFGLWDSIPDADLLKAAAAGQLKTREQLTRQAERMLADPRAKAKLHGFLLTWLRADQARDLMKDAKRFPDFDAATIADLRTSLELFLDDVLDSPKADFRQLLLSEDIFLNERLANFYGAEPPEEPGFVKATLDPGQRAGVLTHPYLMASFAGNLESSPIHRGVFLARGVLGVTLRPPPEAVVPLPADLHPDLNTRERVVLQTKSAACMTCHGVINPLGFTLEHFDAVGRFRDKDHGKTIDSSGSYKMHSGKVATVKNARELAKFLAESEDVHDAFAEKLFHHLVQQPVRAYGPTAHDDLRKAFEKNDFNICKLAVEIMVRSALTGRAK